MEVLFVTTVVGGFSTCAGIAIDVTRWVYKGVVHLVFLHGFTVNLHADTRLFRDTVETAAQLDRFCDKLAFPDIHTGNRGPLGLGAYGTEVGCPCCSDAGADELQPEGFVRFFTNGRLLQQTMCAGTNNEAVRYVFVQRGQDGRGTVVHCHRSIDTLTNLFVPGDIALWNRSFQS